jgi:8-oxo-dGTP pyrophosphatase MutT (NUDIX family)
LAAEGDRLLDDVTASVAARSPIDEREAGSRQRILSALASLPAPFDQAADATHVTGSAVVIGARGVLLHLHKRLGMWLQPGGHLEPGETPWDAALREAQEETGLQLRWHPSLPAGEVPTLAHDGGRGHTHLDLRYILTPVSDVDPCPPEGESQEVRWFAWDEAIRVADPGLSAFLRSCRRDSVKG